MVFFTFSAADFHWPDLHNLMSHGSSLGELSEQEASTCRRQDLIENPHITAWYFERRFKLFFEKVLVPKWNLEDWWFRFEWQHRGCSHVHGIAKKKDAPIIDWDEMKNDEEVMTDVVQYLDSLVTTINPGLGAFVPERHPVRNVPMSCVMIYRITLN